MKKRLGTPSELSSMEIRLNAACLVTLPEELEVGQTIAFGDDKTQFEIEVIEEPIATELTLTSEAH